MRDRCAALVVVDCCRVGPRLQPKPPHDSPAVKEGAVSNFASAAGRSQAYEIPHGPPPTVSIQLDGSDPSSYRAARIAAADVFDQYAAETHRNDVASVTHELVTNAIRHGADPIRLFVTATPEETLVAVFDAGSGMPIDEPQPARGLQIVDVLSDSWGTDVIGAGKWVWANLR